MPCANTTKGGQLVTEFNLKSRESIRYHILFPDLYLYLKNVCFAGTDSLMLWNANPELVTENEFVETAADSGLSILNSNSKSVQFDNLLNRYPEAVFESLSNGKIALILPHKQVDYPIHTTNGLKQLYPLSVYNLPVADFVSNTSGTVDKNYTKQVKKIAEMINNFYHFPEGRQIQYIPVLNDRENLPPLDQKWKEGDYILVGDIILLYYLLLWLNML